jgi:hypothetical protein
MQFSVIYSFDVPADLSVNQYKPPKWRRWDLTECGTSENDDGGKHRKYCALLTQEQFDDFVAHCDLYAERCRTMGSLGAPGFGFGWSPAVSFCSDNGIYANAYVTPVGSKAEIVQFLREHDQLVPQILLDSDNQQYLFDGIEEDEGPQVWDALESLMWDKYAA